MQFSVFLDSDVIISSLISQTGAAHLLFQQSTIERIIAETSEKEIIPVMHPITDGCYSISSAKTETNSYYSPENTSRK